MKVDGKLNVTGCLQVVMNGKLHSEFDNLVVTAGKEWVAGMMTGVGNAVSHMAVGTSTSIASVGQTALVAEIDRNALTVAGGTAVAATVQYACTWGAGDGNGALTEAALFDNSSGGNMIARTVFNVITKDPEDVMTIIWTITIA